jgi:hypothetical protein
MKNNKGITLLVSLITVSMLALVSFVVVNVALKQLIIGYGNQESQYAFYNADGGIDCAIYWDLQKNGNPSPFDPYTTLPYSPTPRCNNQNLTFLTPTPPPVVSGYSTTTFQANLLKGCIIVDVVKKVGLATTTKVDSRGYNTCTGGALRRYERGVEIRY